MEDHLIGDLVEEGDPKGTGERYTGCVLNQSIDWRALSAPQETRTDLKRFLQD